MAAVSPNPYAVHVLLKLIHAQPHVLYEKLWPSPYSSDSADVSPATIASPPTISSAPTTKSPPQTTQPPAESTSTDPAPVSEPRHPTSQLGNRPNRLWPSPYSSEENRVSLSSEEQIKPLPQITGEPSAGAGKEPEASKGRVKRRFLCFVY